MANRYLMRCFRCRKAGAEIVEIGFETPNDHEGTVGTAWLCEACEAERPRELRGRELRRWLRGL